MNLLDSIRQDADLPCNRAHYCQVKGCTWNIAETHLRESPFSPSAHRYFRRHSPQHLCGAIPVICTRDCPALVAPKVMGLFSAACAIAQDVPWYAGVNNPHDLCDMQVWSEWGNAPLLIARCSCSCHAERARADVRTLPLTYAQRLLIKRALTHYRVALNSSQTEPDEVDAELPMLLRALDQ